MDCVWFMFVELFSQFFVGDVFVSRDNQFFIYENWIEDVLLDRIMVNIIIE